MRLARRLVSALAATAVISTGACSGNDDGLLSAEEAQPLFDEVAELAARVPAISAAMGAAADPTQVPADGQAVLYRLGVLNWIIRSTVEPEAGYAAVAAVNDASVEAALAAGGRREGRTLVTLAPGVAAATPPSQEETYRNYNNRVRDDPQAARGSLDSAMAGAIDHLIYLCLLAAPGSRAAFLTRPSPGDLPATLPVDPTNPGGGVDSYLSGADSVAEWRDSLFDRQGRLILPHPGHPDSRWRYFLAWTQYLNEDLAVALRHQDDYFGDGYRADFERSLSGEEPATDGG